ncbi:hypothetical protein C440_02698 [Haloferax mucosum ATCC BAA-1512]|uniref:Uncharacterized protein n=1 Tax=Haloferax mucosum ATCC BAA-1512 TaxID=662479 RepID=M0IMT9_9EURY|nr:hypothetical protein [Haloferax mucosum]ELZ98121.1 hypothetical protein C440_02698 [Haloferax mucosum ATCC BAA-1512]
MSQQTRRSFLRKSAVTTVGLGAVATGGAAAESKTPASEVTAGHVDPEDVHVVGDGITTLASWPFSRDFNDLTPGQISAVSSLAIVEGGYYEFDVSYSPELPLGLCFLDMGTEKYYTARVTDSGQYNVESPVGIPEDSAAVGVLNYSDNSRDLSGDFSVDN